MPSTSTILATTLAVVASASPIEPVVPRLGFTVSAPLKLAPESANINPALKLAHPFYKYATAQPPVIKAAVKSQGRKDTGATGSVTTTPEPYDVEYLVPVNINGKIFHLVLDSGSSDLWVYSDLMPAAQQAGHTIYRTTAAKRQEGQTYGITYGDGSYSRGQVYTDTVSIGGVSFAKQAVEAAVNVSKSFLTHVDADGLLGLSMKALNTVRPTRQNTFFENVRSDLAIPVYAVTLKNRGPEPLDDEHIGSLDFGFVNASKFDGPLTWIDVKPKDAAFWQFPISKFAIAGVDNTMNMATNGRVQSFNAIVDTGTSLSYFPQAIIQAYYRKVQGAGIDDSWGGYTFPCDARLPAMGVYIAGQKFTIKSMYINWEQINATHCLGGVQSSAGLPFAILGDTFLKAMYVAFDYRKGYPRVGLARQVGL